MLSGVLYKKINSKYTNVDTYLTRQEKRKKSLDFFFLSVKVSVSDPFFLGPKSADMDYFLLPQFFFGLKKGNKSFTYVDSFSTSNYKTGYESFDLSNQKYL